MHCAKIASEAEDGWEYFRDQLLAAQHQVDGWGISISAVVWGHRWWPAAAPRASNVHY